MLESDFDYRVPCLIIVYRVPCLIIVYKITLLTISGQAATDISNFHGTDISKISRNFRYSNKKKFDSPLAVKERSAYMGVVLSVL